MLKMKNLSVFLFLAVCSFLLNGCLNSSRVMLTEASMTVFPAPEVMGANGKIEKNSSAILMRGGVNVGGNETIYAGKLENDFSEELYEGCKKCGAGPDPKYQYAKLFYDLKTRPLFLTMDVLRKYDLFTWGVGIGYDNISYMSGSFGINTDRFELGASLSIGVALSDLYLKGRMIGCQSCSGSGCSSGDWKKVYKDDYSRSNEDELYWVIAPGIYASYYWGSFSVTYSGSFYEPENPFKDVVPTSEYEAYIVRTKGSKLPVIVTNRFSAGYRFPNGIGFRAGATQVYGDFAGWYWSGFGAIELAIL